MNWARQVETQLRTTNPTHPWSVAHELIERAAELRITDRYTLGQTYPITLVDGQPVFPAIAIPVEKKGTFECPQELIDELTALLPQVSKVLVIGWRATEDHFLSLLKTHLKRGAWLHVVSGKQMEAENVRVRIQRALINNPPSSNPAEDGGFTDFILSRAAEGFLGT